MAPLTIDPAGLSLAQQRGERCAWSNCRKYLIGNGVFFGSLPDGTPIFVCPECTLDV